MELMKLTPSGSDQTIAQMYIRTVLCASAGFGASMMVGRAFDLAIANRQKAKLQENS